MIKAKIKTTGQRIIVRPYSHEFYDFVCCNEDGSIQGTLLRRDELEIIGDKQEEIIEKACEWMKEQVYQEYGGGPLERLIPDTRIEEFRKAIE